MLVVLFNSLILESFSFLMTIKLFFTNLKLSIQHKYCSLNNDHFVL